LAERLQDVKGPVADLGAGAGEGASLLRARGLEVVGYDEAREAVDFATRFAPEVPFVLGAVENADLRGYEALVLVDVLGLVSDDAALLRALAGNVSAGSRLLGAVVLADVDQVLESPCRRAYSPEDLDALLVRTGWGAPVLVGRTPEMLVFESRRALAVTTAAAMARAERVTEVRSAEAYAAASALAAAAERTTDPSEARELLLALGHVLLARGEHDAAERAFTNANAIAPGCARPFTALAAVAEARGARDDAEVLFDHALARDATQVTAWRGLARIFAERGETARAIECLECAAALAPAETDLALELARMRVRVRDLAGAARAVERLLAYGELSPSVQAWYCWLVASVHAPATMARGRADRPTTGVYSVVDPERAAQTVAS
jgi:Flp pilus assembly protein TadD